MQRLFDHQTQQWMEVPDDQIAEGVASGRYSYSENVERVPVVAPDGSLWDVPAENAAQAYARGYKPPTFEATAKHEQARTQEIVEKRFDDNLGAFTMGAFSGATGGLTDLIGGALSPTYKEARSLQKAVNPVANVAGEVAGLVAPFSPFGKAAGAAAKGVEKTLVGAAKDLGVSANRARIASGVFEGSLYSLPTAVSAASLGNPDEAVETLLSTLSEGAVTGGAFSGLGILYDTIKPTARAIMGRGMDLVQSVAQKATKASLPDELKDLATNPALREAAMSPEAATLGKQVNKVDNTFERAVAQEERALRAGVDGRIAQESSKARQLGEAASAAEDVVRASKTQIREEAASTLQQLQQQKSELSRQLTEVKSASKSERRQLRADLNTRIKTIDKTIASYQRQVADTEVALRNSFKHEVGDIAQTADDMLRSSANDIVAARAKAYELKNNLYGKMLPWTDPASGHIDDVSIALHAPANPMKAWQFVEDARETIAALGKSAFKTNRAAANNIEGAVKALFGDDVFKATSAIELNALKPREVTGLDVFNTQMFVKRAIGSIYGKSKAPEDAVHAAYGLFKGRVEKEYGELGRIANEASDAFRVYHGFDRATRSIKAGGNSMRVLRDLFSDPAKAEAIDQVARMVPDLVPEFQALAKAREGTKAYLAAVENLQVAIRKQHVAASSPKLTPNQIADAAVDGMAVAPLEQNYGRIEDAASALSQAEARATSEIGKLSEQRAAAELERRNLLAAGADVPAELTQQLAQLDQAINAAKVTRRSPAVDPSLTARADVARRAQETQTAFVNSARDTVRDMAASSPTFRMQAEDLKMFADKFFPGGKLSERATSLDELKSGYEKLVADGAAGADKYFYFVRATGGNVSKEMENLATALPYQAALDRLARGTDEASMRSTIGSKVVKSAVGSIIGGVLGGPLGSAVGTVAGAMVGGGNPVAALRALSATEKALMSARQFTDKAVDASVRAFTGSTARKIAVPVATRQNEKERRAATTATIRQLSAINDPSSLADLVGRASGGLPPEITTALTQQYSTRVQFLLSKMPHDPLASKYPFGKDIRETYPTSELRRFERYVDAAQNPLETIQRIGSGAATPEEIETLKTLYPRLFGSLKEQMLSAVVEQKKPLSYQQRLILGTTFDVTTDPTMDPNFMGRLYQSEFARLAQQEQATAGAAAEQRTKLSNGDMADDIQTDVQRTTEDK